MHFEGGKCHDSFRGGRKPRLKVTPAFGRRADRKRRHRPVAGPRNPVSELRIGPLVPGTLSQSRACGPSSPAAHSTGMDLLCEPSRSMHYLFGGSDWSVATKSLNGISRSKSLSLERKMNREYMTACQFLIHTTPADVSWFVCVAALGPEGPISVSRFENINPIPFR